ncbi:ParB/RepB/Spo0J family partition protein [Streptococcus catagoni]|uniref:ParB/RepB/Spo0J family partition protein n=1 Tax=Streptococcus catagoni TaxID=2654874 RepID=UPI0014082DD1|nr:ParB/RepB/Spo0J family partition protein [Streptococcus catagoni]
MAEIYKKIATKDIVANPHQPRLHFKSEELKELADSIKLNGLIQPIIVRKSEIYGYELIAGERRLRASQLAGLTEIPAIIKEISTKESMNQAIIENLQRSDLSPIEEAKAYQNIITKNHLTHEQLAKFMGKSRPYITNSLRLLQLPKSIEVAIEEGEISPGHARALLSLENPKEQEHYLQRIIKQGLNVRQTEDLLKTHQRKNIKNKEKNIFIQAIEKDLAKRLGVGVHISQKKDMSGSLSFHFSNEEEFNRIINNLK